MSELLVCDELVAGYGDATILDGFSLSMAEGDSLALLGRNGVGKSTFLVTLMGQTRVTRGTLQWRGADLRRVPAHLRARAGLGWVEQERGIFPTLTVEENLTVAARPGKWHLQRVFALFPRLRERRRNFGNELSGGEQQMLSIGRALLLNPALLLLDEPLEGLAPVIVDELAGAIAAMARDEGQALILVEQHVDQALRLTQQAAVVERGRVVLRAASSALLADPQPLERWLGMRASD